MKLFTQHEKRMMAEAPNVHKSTARRVLALVLALGMLLDLVGTGPARMLALFNTEVMAETSFTYEPGNMGAAVLPKNEILTLKKVQDLELNNPSIVLDINGKFAKDRWSSTFNHPEYCDVVDDPVTFNHLYDGEALSRKFYWPDEWLAQYVWNPSKDELISKHLTNQAMDLEVFWEGSYKRSELGNPSVTLWYYGENNEEGQLRGNIASSSNYIETQGGELKAGETGTAQKKDYGNKAIPLSYKSYFTYEHGKVVYLTNENGIPVADVSFQFPFWEEGTLRFYYDTVDNTKFYDKTVVGDRMFISMTKNFGPFLPDGAVWNPSHYSQNSRYPWDYTPLFLTISGKAQTSVSHSKIRMRDNAAPFLNKIIVSKDGQAIEGDYYYTNSSDPLEIVLEFNEDIRFSDNARNNHNLKLRLQYTDALTGSSDSDCYVQADLVRLEGQKMVFRFDPQNPQSKYGKTLPEEYYINSLSGQDGWIRKDAFPLSLIDANGNTVNTGETINGVITDLAGNPFERFNITRLGSGTSANTCLHSDNLDPTVFKTIIWTNNLSKEEASGGNNINETDPDKLFLKVGDQVNFKVAFSEELRSEDSETTGSNLLDEDGDVLAPAATLNVLQNGSIVTLNPKTIYKTDSKTIDVQAAQRMLTTIEYEPLTITSDMTVDGEFIKITGIADLDDMVDLANNHIENPTVPSSAYKQRIDVTPPVIAIGDIIEDTAGADVFTIPITITDEGGSGIAGQILEFRLRNEPNRCYLWKVDNQFAMQREADGTTVNTDGWKTYSRALAQSTHYFEGWNSVDDLSIQDSQMYLHIKLLQPQSWTYALSDIQGAYTGTYKSMISDTIDVAISDVKGNEASSEKDFSHALNDTGETGIEFGSATFRDNKAFIPVKVRNPVGIQKLTYGSSEDGQANTVWSGELRKDNQQFTAELPIEGESGTVILYVAAYGADGTPETRSNSYAYDFTAGELSYQKNSFGDEKTPIFGLPEISNMSVTDGDRTMVLIDKGDGTFWATRHLVDGDHNLFISADITWYKLTGTAASDYSSLTLTAEPERVNDASQVTNWLRKYYGKLPIVFLNQDSHLSSGGGAWSWDGDWGWEENGDGKAPGSYTASANNGIVIAVEYAYLANIAQFTVTPSVVYSDGGDPVDPDTLSGRKVPRSNLSDYTFIAELANDLDASANQFYGLRIVEAAEAELYYTSDRVPQTQSGSYDYTSVRKVDLSVGSTTKLRFTKADGENTGWYKVVYRYTVNGTTKEVTIADRVYIDNTSKLEPAAIRYNRSFKMYVREPKWQYGEYQNEARYKSVVDYSFYEHSVSAAYTSIGVGEVVKIGLAPIVMPDDKLPNGAEFLVANPDSSNINTDAQYLDRYYLAGDETNTLEFMFFQTSPTYGTDDISRVNGVNHFYAWSGNDPDGRESARDAWHEISEDRKSMSLTVVDGTDGFDYTDGKLPLTDGYNLIHYVVEYEGGETAEETLMVDVRTKAMDLGLDVYYHEPDYYMTDAQVDEEWARLQDLLDEDGNLKYASKEDYLASRGAIETQIFSDIDDKQTVDPQDDEPIYEHAYVIPGEKCADEADLYHRREAVVSPVLNDYDAARAYSFAAYRQLVIDPYLGGHQKIVPNGVYINGMQQLLFRQASENELFFAEDNYGNVSFASLSMDNIDGEAPKLSFESNFEEYSLDDVLRRVSSDIYTGFDFLLDLEDDSPLDVTGMTVTFDPDYSKALRSVSDGEGAEGEGTDEEEVQLTMKVPLNTEKDEFGYFRPWVISEEEAGTTGGITMTCLKLDTNPTSPKFGDVIGLEIQGVIKPSEDIGSEITMTFQLSDPYGNQGSAELVIPNNEESGYIANTEDYVLHAGIQDNEGWYEGRVETDAYGNDLYPNYIPGYAELPDWAPEIVYYCNNGQPLDPDGDWKESVKTLLPELDYYWDYYGTGAKFTNDGYVKVGIVRESDAEYQYAATVPSAVSVESYQTDYGIFTDGYVRTRPFEKLTGRNGTSASSFNTEQAIILPSVTEDGIVTVNWTDVFGAKHANDVFINAFGNSSEEMGVRASFSPNTLTNEDMVVTIKGDRIKDDATSATTTCEITGINVMLQDEDGTSFDQSDERVRIYDSQPWNATVLMPANGVIVVNYRYPRGTRNDEQAAQQDKYTEGSRAFHVNAIDKVPPTPTVSYVFADTGEAVPEQITESTRRIRADVTADEPIERMMSGLSYTFPYGAAAGETQTVSIRDKAGNVTDVTVVCPAAISTPDAAPTENNAPTATVYLSANLGGKVKSLGTFTLNWDGDSEVTSIGEDGTQTTTTVNHNNEAVASINRAISSSIATLYTLRFEIYDENPDTCTLTSSNPEIATVGADNTLTITANGTFNVTVSDSDSLSSSLSGIVVNSLDTEAPKVTPVYNLYTAEDGTPRVRVAFQSEEQIFPILTGEHNSRDIRSTIYNVYAEDGVTVLETKTGFFTDFAANEDYTFYYSDAYGNDAGVVVKVRGMDTDAPSVTSILWSGTVNNMTPDTPGAGPINGKVNATLKTDKGLSFAELRYFDENAENQAGEPLNFDDAQKVSLTFATNQIEVTWKDNVDSKLILVTRSAIGGQYAYYELPAVNVIDKIKPVVTLDGTPKLADDKSYKEFRFTVSGTEGEVFSSNHAASYTIESIDGVDVMRKNAIGVKGTQFVYTAKSNTPVTLRFTDDAANSTEYQLTSEMLEDIDIRGLSVKFNKSASDEGAVRSLSELGALRDDFYIYTSKEATVTMVTDLDEEASEEGASDVGTSVNVPAKTWTSVPFSSGADIQIMKIQDKNTGRMAYEWLVSHNDKLPPVISFTGESLVFADTDMTLAAIQTLVLSDVSAYDAVDGVINKATITVNGCSTAAGLHTITYSASDQEGNTAETERYLYVRGKYDPVIRVNGKETAPLGTTILNTKEISITSSCSLAGDNSVYLAVRPGIMTAARMKYTTASGSDSLSYTAPADGYYTVLARNRDRTEVLTYICVNTTD